MEKEVRQKANSVEPNGEALRLLTQSVDSLTDAVRELSWILLEGWKWKPVEDKESQAKAPSRVGG